MSKQTEALQLAKLWASGKMVAGDAYEVASVLAKQVEELQAENEELRMVLKRAKQDINWMLNSRQFLDGVVFHYIDAIAKQK